jgi:hypothetical protein
VRQWRSPKEYSTDEPYVETLPLSLLP